ncbi:MAG TPA: hypothetical protein PK431_03095 [Chitinophagales bacterium]|jgi:hypothetical protein|nr:hypothetical protein [Chitinophagales bacterium]
MTEELYFDRPILALYPNTHGFGYALFFDKDKPLHYGMAKLRVRKVEACLRRIDKMIVTYNPSILILPSPDGKHNRKRERIQALLSEIHEYATEKGLQVRIYSRENIRIAFASYKAYSKQQIAETICECVPELGDKCPRQRTNYETESFLQGMFDAISLAYTHYYFE